MPRGPMTEEQKERMRAGREAAKAAKAAAVENAPAPEPDLSRIVLVCDNIYLPEDLATDDWAGMQVKTRRYEGRDENGKRTRLEVNPQLAKFLSDRGQAELVD